MFKYLKNTSTLSTYCFPHIYIYIYPCPVEFNKYCTCNIHNFSCFNESLYTVNISESGLLWISLIQYLIMGILISIYSGHLPVSAYIIHIYIHIFIVKLTTYITFSHYFNQIIYKILISETKLLVSLHWIYYKAQTTCYSIFCLAYMLIISLTLYDIYSDYVDYGPVKFIYTILQTNNSTVQSIVNSKLLLYPNSVMSENYKYLMSKYKLSHLDWNLSLLDVLNKIKVSPLSVYELSVCNTVREFMSTLR